MTWRLKKSGRTKKISQEALAAHLGGTWTQPKISAIITNKRRVTEAIALDFADALGTSAEFWLNLQISYDLWHQLKKHKKIPLLPEIRRLKTRKQQVKPS